MLEWLRTHRKPIAAVAAAVAIGLFVVLAIVYPEMADAQRARSFAGLDVDDVTTGAYLDLVFIAAYAVASLAAFALVRDPRRSDRMHSAALAGAVLAVGGAVADVVENVFLLVSDDGTDGRALTTMRAAGLVKWTLLGAATLTLLTLVVRRSWRPTPIPGRSTDRPPRPPGPPKKHPWDPPAKGARAKIGICLSGGGIRSAAFCQGAVQALRENGKLAKAKYLTAASGGGYFAAGWAVSAAGPPDDKDLDPTSPARWSQGSAEERWFRDHASYLVPDLKGGLAGLFRLLAGLVVNLLLIGLVLFVVSRPVGWVMHELHPKLRAKAPAVLIRDSSADMRVDSVRRTGTIDNGDEPPAVRYEVRLSPLLKAKPDGDHWPPNNACFDLEPYKPKARDACVGVAQDDAHPGIVDVQGGKAKVVAQPKVIVTTARDEPDHEELREAAFVSEKPKLGFEGDIVADSERPTIDQFALERQPKVSVKTGLWAMTYPTYEWWMWEVIGGLLGAALLVALVVMALRLRGRTGDVVRALARALAGAGLVAFLVIVALPWAVVWVPRTLTSLVSSTTKSASASGFQDYLLPGGGMLALVVTAARQFLAGSKGKAGSGTGESTSWVTKVWGALSKRSAQLKWYDLSPGKVLVAVLSFVGVTVAFVNLLQFSAANGWRGELMGFAFVRDYLPGWMFVPEYVKFLVAVAALALFASGADAQAWSLYPFYKARLSSAFLLRRIDPDHAEPIPYDVLVPFTTLQKPDEGPQLVACCAVNLNEYGVVPPGRRAASFTFSSTEIGGPLVGYATPEEYEALPLSRRRDVTVASAMAISGAAFSPAMGKFNLGPIGSLLALANLRLGVWIPHPQRVRARGAEWWSRPFRRPHWVWFLRELTNKYRFDRRYVYVSDGGHWDNLGLVELLRRGCTEIYCISGAGDGASSFSTIGEAMALAREELGVEVSLDPSPLRAPTVPPAVRPERELRREGAKDKAAPFAAASFKPGTFTFRDVPGVTGQLYYVEADLTADMPFDVHTFAESEPIFPDDSTGDQVFSHRQFESYRALGYHQTAAVFKVPLP